MLVQALLGGVIIGVAASLLWVVCGRIAGISGILGELLAPSPDGVAWRWSFLGGLLVGGAILGLAAPERVAPIDQPWLITLLAGVLVGVGTRIGNGCTSGHGVCGIPRGSTRSLVATGTFIGVGMITVAIFGGA